MSTEPGEGKSRDEAAPRVLATPPAIETGDDPLSMFGGEPIAPAPSTTNAGGEPSAAHASTTNAGGDPSAAPASTANAGGEPSAAPASTANAGGKPSAPVPSATNDPTHQPTESAKTAESEPVTIDPAFDLDLSDYDDKPSRKTSAPAVEAADAPFVIDVPKREPPARQVANPIPQRRATDRPSATPPWTPMPTPASLSTPTPSPTPRPPLTTTPLPPAALRGAPPPRKIPFHPLHLVPIVALALVTVGLSYLVYRVWPRSDAGSAAVQQQSQQGRVTVESEPTGAQVQIDGVARGTTPVGVRLPKGRHVLRVAGPTSSREIPIEVTSGVEVVHHVQLAEARTRLHVDTQPTGASVTVDGRARGRAPLDLDDLSAGSHEVSVNSGTTTVRRTVNVNAATDNSVVIALGWGGVPNTGWLTVTSPVDVDVYEGDRLLGRSRDGRLLLLAGPHDLSLLNRDLGLQQASSVTIPPGNTATVKVEARKGQLAVNAIPWAEVWLDGQRIGETPIANYPATIGSHELVLRNPDFGEQRRTVVVTLTAPARVGVNFRQ